MSLLGALTYAELASLQIGSRRTLLLYSRWVRALAAFCTGVPVPCDLRGDHRPPGPRVLRAKPGGIDSADARWSPNVAAVLMIAVVTWSTNGNAAKSDVPNWTTLIKGWDWWCF